MPSVQTAMTISIMKSFHALVAKPLDPDNCRSLPSKVELFTIELNHKLSLTVDKTHLAGISLKNVSILLTLIYLFR